MGELEPRFIVTVTLDGDDYPPTATENVEAELRLKLAEMQDAGTIHGFTVT